MVALLVAAFGLAGVLVAGLLARRALRAARMWRHQATRRRAAAEEARRALLEHVTLEERARIARELHDVVAHHISMIAVQAEAARLLVPDLAPDGERRMVEIGDTARAALTEMRRLLGVLRDGGGDGTPGTNGASPGSRETPDSTGARSEGLVATSRRPQPGLGQLTALVDEAREHAGATMRLIVRGPVAPLDPGVELTAYRIVQEALTNARRHAPGAAVDVELDYRPAALVLRVRDSGLGARASVPLPDRNARRVDGHGLNGMRERTAMLDGELTVGPLADGGFAVTATLPRVGPS